MENIIVGYPFQPKVHEGTSCGPVVLATVLGINTKEAEKLMNETTPKGFNGGTNVGHLRKALESKGLIFHCANRYWNGKTKIPNNVGMDLPVAIFIQIDGPWVQKGWRSAYNHTHWALVNKGMVMEINNKHHSDPHNPQWVHPEFWETVMDALVEYIDGATGWYIRGGYITSQPTEEMI